MSDAHDSPSVSTRVNRCHFPPIDTHLLRSKHVAQSFQIKVMQPLQSKESATRFPVLYLTDGNALFDLASGIAALMQAFRSESSRFILVAVGYPGQSPIAGEALRGRDLTFPGCPDFVRGHSLLAEWDGVLLPPAGTTDFGGAAEFQRFLGEELIPYIDARYPTVPHVRAYFGCKSGRRQADGCWGVKLFLKPCRSRGVDLNWPRFATHAFES